VDLIGPSTAPNPPSLEVLPPPTLPPLPAVVPKQN